MNKVKIGDIATVYDGPHATPKKIAEGPIYLGLDGITDDGRFNPSGFAHLSEEDYAVWTRRVTPQEDDIVFSYEATLGRYVLIPKGFYGCLGRRLGIVRCDKTKVNPRWLYYFFLSPEWTYFTQAHKVRGSTVDRLSVDDFPGYEIPLPSLDVQNRTVSAIFPIDQKIDLNTRLCAELEAMAKTLYDYWFVQFDFPDENGKPYRTSGGAMEKCKELGREVAKGWKAGTLSDIANITMGQSPAGESYNENGDGMMFFQGSTDFGSRFPMPRVYTTAPTRFAKNGDILMSVRAPVGALNIAMEDCCIGRGLAALNSKIGSQIYLIQLLNNFRAVFDSMNGNGTTFGSINKDTLHALKVIIPPNSVLQQFEEIVTPIEKQIRECEKENRELSSLRDWLLPMLMNGQAKVIN